MKFEAFAEGVAQLPVIESRNCVRYFRDERHMYVQLSRWQKGDRLIQLARGIYVLAPRYRKIECFEPYVAGLLRWPSYVSLEKALEHHGVIPEAVPVYTSVTTQRPTRCDTPAGVFDYRHLQAKLFWGYQSVTVNRQTGFVALPEKALLDLIYLKPVAVSRDYFEEMRLENLETFRERRLRRFAARFNKPKISKAVECFLEFLKAHRKEVRKR